MSKENIKNKGEITPFEERHIANRNDTLSRGFDSIFDDFRRSFDGLMAPFLPMRTSLATSSRFPTRYPLCDLVDQGDNFVVKAELPGLKKENVDVQLNKDTLVIHAEMEEKTEEDDGQYLHRERTYSSVNRTVRFPEEVDPDKVKGEMENGVLVLTIPKKEPKPEEKLRKVELK